MEVAERRANVFERIGLYLLIISPYFVWVETSVSFRHIIVPVGFLLLGAIIRRTFPFKLHHKLALLFVLESMISTFVAFEDFSSTVIISLLFGFVYVLATSREINVDIFARIIDMYVIASIIIASLIVLSAVFNKPHSGEYFVRYSINILGINKNPNYLSAFLCAPYAMVLYRVMLQNFGHKIKKIVSIAYVLILAAGILLTGTRAAWLALAAITFLEIACLILSRGSATKKAMHFIILLLLIALAVYVLNRYIPRNIFNRFSLSDPFRENAWRMAWEDFINSNFVTGFGINGVKSHITAVGDDLHSMILQTLFEQGIVGIFLLVWLIMTDVKWISKDDLFYIFVCSVGLFYPFLFNNGCYTVSFWFPIILLRFLKDFSIERKIYNWPSIADAWLERGKI